MPTHRHLVGRVAMGLLFIVMAAACSLFGPELSIDLDNTDGAKEVTLTVDSSGPGLTSSEDAIVPPRQGVAWSQPLGSTWEVKVDGKHVIGSGDRTDLALPSPGQRQDVTISIRVARDGTMTVQATR
jgi:hypothetical protein